MTRTFRPTISRRYRFMVSRGWACARPRWTRLRGDVVGDRAAQDEGSNTFFCGIRNARRDGTEGGPFQIDTPIALNLTESSTDCETKVNRGNM